QTQTLLQWTHTTPVDTHYSRHTYTTPVDTHYSRHTHTHYSTHTPCQRARRKSQIFSDTYLTLNKDWSVPTTMVHYRKFKPVQITSQLDLNATYPMQIPCRTPHQRWH